MGAKKKKRVKPHREYTDKRFSVREKRGLLYLLPLLAVGSWIAFEAARPRARHADPAVTQEIRSETAAAETPEPAADTARLFPFDPNTVEYHDLMRLGFTRAEALGIVKYRERGKIFEIPEDFASCYQVGEDMYLRLRPYIRIGEKYRLKPFADREHAATQTAKSAAEPELHPFSLDTATVAGLRSLGFSGRQAQVVINYRDMKGGLRSAEEFAECYAVSDEMFRRLEPWLVFPEPRTVTAAAPSPVDLNRADSATLRSVAGIGEKTVMAILEYRERLGGFARKEQLAEVRGVTERNYELIAAQIFADSCDIRKIDINFASAKELAAHPYVRPEALRKLLKIRQLKGGWSTSGELVEDKIFTPEEAAKMAPYLLFGDPGQ